MKPIRAPRIALLALAAILAATAPLRAEKVRNHFDADGVMRPPGFFDPVVLGAPGPARWLILTDLNPPSTSNCLVQTDAARPADSIAAAVRRNYSFRDGAVSTFVKRGLGRGGLLLRMADEKNFLVLLVDTTSGEAVLSRFQDGKPAELGRGKASLAQGWEKFGVTAAGSALSVFFGDQKMFDAVDPRPVAGRTGLATAGPGETRFDEFILEPADGPKK